MPEKTTQRAGRVGFPPMMLPFGLEAFMELNRPALTAMAQMNGKVYENIATMNKNWVAFVNRRLKEDFAMPQQLAACKTVQDMYGVYAEFFQTAVRRLPVRVRADEQARQVAGGRDRAGHAGARGGNGARARGTTDALRPQCAISATLPGCIEFGRASALALAARLLDIRAAGRTEER